MKRIVDFPESSQLFTPILELQLYDYVSQCKIQTIDGNNIPFMTWPDGSPCLPANSYMIKLRTQPGRGGHGPSRSGTKGGTFGQYAGQISHLIRFCYYNNLGLTSISDDDFCCFIDGLRKEKKPDKPNQLKRTERTITGIGRRCLSFLAFVGNLGGTPNFVGIGGTIPIVMTDTILYRNGKAFKCSSIHHRSFRTANALRTRRPIQEKTIAELRSAIDEISTSEFLCTRRHIMISLFEELGARRAEVQAITVASVISAAKVERPMITINTLKQGRTGVTRAIELSPALIDELINYIRGERRLVMKRFKHIPDHGFLFVTERGGRPLGIDTITTEFSIIRRAAGIEEQACAHLFRHAFCTNIAAQLIAEVQALSPESFRQTLLTNKMLAERALSMSGHAVLESFLQYVDNAFKIKSKYEQIIHNVQFARTYEGYEKRRKRLLEALKKDRISKAKYIEREEFLSKAIQCALENPDQPYHLNRKISGM